MEITKSLVQTESCDENLKAFEAEFLVDRLEELEKISLDSLDFDSLKAIGHKWKGFSKPYGFNCLAELGIELENNAKEKDEEGVRLTLESVRSYLRLKKESLSL
ncbi:MAG: hypothetical protein VXV96_15385 [Bdellovibrionota bacterium]|nr:hypothetical protein [Bdellovibrionota bacterium]